MSRTWIQTSGGLKFHPLEPKAADVDLYDIARGLAMTCRYAGQVKTAGHFYSVAEHCVWVSKHVPREYALHGLLHDSAEAYIGDMVRPLKHRPELAGFRLAEERIELAVAERFGLDWTPEARAAVKAVDDRILVDEIRQVTANPDLYLTAGGDGKAGTLAGLEPLGVTLWLLPPYAAERLFLTRFYELTP